MSYNQSMSPPLEAPPQSYSPSAYSQQSAGSPTNPYGVPPAKRPRLSPDARSPPNGAVMPPYASSPHGLPSVGSYGNPYAPAPSPFPNSPSPYTAGSPQSSFASSQPYHPPQQQQWSSQPPTPAAGLRQTSPPNTQNQTPSSQMMPPPPRPNKEDKDERMNIDDIGDSMFGSGVNLKDEENYLHSTLNNQQHQYTNSFTSSTQSASLGGSTVISPNNSFNLLTQSASFGTKSGTDGVFADTLGPPQSQEEIEKEDKRKRADAVRARNERWQHHMNNQFLLTNCVRARLMKKAQDEGVTADVRGLYKRVDEPSRTQTMTNGDSGIVAIDTRPEFTTCKGEPFEQIMCLISLASGERLRGLIDDAFAIARARKYGDHGRVPPEFADIAVGEGEKREESVVPENVTGSQWTKVPETESNGEMANGVNGNQSSIPQPQPTVSFQNPVISILRNIAKRDKAAEEERIRKREARRKRAREAADAAEEAALETPATEVPPETAAPPKISKKEQERQKKEASRNADAMSHSTTNQTAAMMAMGSKGKKYSWMTGGSAARLENKWAKPNPTASGTATPREGLKSEGASPGGQAMSRGASGQGVNVATEKVPEWGDWREDGLEGKGMQPRDWVYVLERDGKDKKALQRAYAKLR